MSSNDAGDAGPVEVLIGLEPGDEDAERLSALVRNAAQAALTAEHTSGPSAVTVLLSDDEQLRELNRRFNDDDSVTDVLSFDEVEGWRDGGPPVELQTPGFAMPGEELRLGEVVISVEQARRQARDRGVQFEWELAMLTVHGVLHLLGYDHAGPDEERVMFSKTDAVLASLFEAESNGDDVR